MAVYVSKSDIEALIKDLQKISTENDNVKKNIDSAIKDIEKQSYDAKDDQVAKLKDIKKKLDQQVSTANEMVKIFQDTQNGFFTIDNNFKKKAAEIAITGGIAGITTIIGNGEKQVTNADTQEQNKQPSTTTASIDFDYEEKKAEIDAITKKAIADDMTWNYVVKDAATGKGIPGWSGGIPIYGTDGKGNAVGTISCVSFSKNKLFERGLISDPKGTTVSGFDESYKTWANENTVPKDMGKATVAFLKDALSKNGGKPVNNIYVSANDGNGHTHTSLIDMAYLDEKGNLKVVLSENQSGDNSNLLYTKDGHPFRPFLETKEMTEQELNSRWSVSAAPNTFKIFG